MPILTDMKRVVGEQRLGFYSTVCEDGSQIWRERRRPR